jgi:predicted RNA binding protein YcfA (HicA-like mRNA interferase family)
MKAVSGEDLCKILERQGWTLVRTRGSHHRYEKAGFPPVTVPVHGNRTLKTGLQKSIMKDAGLTEDDL